MATILGVGNIGSLVVQGFAEKGVQLYLWSRRLQNESTHLKTLQDLQLDQYKSLHCPTTIQEGFQQSDCIVITLPLTKETTGLVIEKDIQAIPFGTRFISTSFPESLSEDAIKALYARQDIDVVFDHLIRDFEWIYQVLGTRALRSNFILDEKAAVTEECQIAMDEAVIALFRTLID